MPLEARDDLGSPSRGPRIREISLASASTASAKGLLQTRHKFPLGVGTSCPWQERQDVRLWPGAVVVKRIPLWRLRDASSSNGKKLPKLANLSRPRKFERLLKHKVRRGPPVQTFDHSHRHKLDFPSETVAISNASALSCRSERLVCSAICRSSAHEKRNVLSRRDLGNSVRGRVSQGNLCFRFRMHLSCSSSRFGRTPFVGIMGQILFGRQSELTIFWRGCYCAVRIRRMPIQFGQQSQQIPPRNHQACDNSSISFHPHG